MTSSNGEQTFAASLRPARLATMLAHLLPAGAGGSAAHVLRAAHGSVTVDSSTHLPASATLSVDAVTPASMVKRAQGIAGVHLQIDVTFSHWNAPAHVSAPAASTPLRLSHLSLPGGLTG